MTFECEGQAPKSSYVCDYVRVLKYVRNNGFVLRLPHHPIEFDIVAVCDFRALITASVSTCNPSRLPRTVKNVYDHTQGYWSGDFSLGRRCDAGHASVNSILVENTRSDGWRKSTTLKNLRENERRKRIAVLGFYLSRERWG